MKKEALLEEFYNKHFEFLEGIPFSEIPPDIKKRLKNLTSFAVFCFNEAIKSVANPIMSDFKKALDEATSQLEHFSKAYKK